MPDDAPARPSPAAAITMALQIAALLIGCLTPLIAVTAAYAVLSERVAANRLAADKQETALAVLRSEVIALRSQLVELRAASGCPPLPR